MTTHLRRPAATAAARANADPDARFDSTAVRRMCGGVPDMTIRRWVIRGILPAPQHIQRRRYWRRADIIKALSAHREPPPPSPCPSGPVARNARRAGADRGDAA